MRSLAFLMLLSSSKADVARIKADVEAIVRDGSTLRAKKVELTNHSHALEGGDGTLFIDRTTGLLRRANVRLLGETYRTNVELYFRDETLVFVFERTSHYVASVAVPGGTAVSWVQEHRYYIDDTRLIRAIANGKTMALTDVDAGALEELTAVATDLRVCAKAKTHVCDPP